ncbi:MAG: MOP flippase family protein [Chitinispirillaceae bacterium]|jgi:O-antigen/teichoic acid export membrane protein|nr:MOP flippase family protein [Chitinispirillaceae bacterium]
MSASRETLTGTGYTAASILLRTLMQLAQYVVLTRVLPPEDFGLIAIVMVVIGFVQIFVDAGMSEYVVVQQKIDTAQINTLFWLGQFCGIFLFVCTWLAAPAVAWFYHNDGITFLIRIAAFGFVAIPAGQLYGSLLQKNLAFKTMAVIEVIAFACGTTAAIMIGITSRNAIALILGMIITTIVSSTAMFAAGRKQFMPTVGISLRQIPILLRFGMYRMGERAVNFGAGNLDKLIIGRLFSMELLGYYSLAFQLAIRPLMIINPVVNRVVFPLFAKIKEDRARLNQVFIDNVSRITFIAFPVYAVIGLFAHPLITLLYGARFDPAAPMLQWLCVLGALWCLGNPIGSYLVAQGKVKTGFYMNCVQAIVTICALSTGFFLPFSTMLIIYVIGYTAIMWPLDYVLRWRSTRMPIARHIRAWGGNALGALLALAASFLIGSQFSGQTILMMVVTGTTFAVCFGAYSFVLNKPVIALFLSGSDR